MKKYVGIKLLLAEPMTLGHARLTHSVHLSKHKYQDSDEGYLVMYPDGYRSWCPKAVFEESNLAVDFAPSTKLTESLVSFSTLRIAEDLVKFGELSNIRKEV